MPNRLAICLPRLQFSLRTLFIAITLLAVWLGYHVNWIHQRREGRKWLGHHGFEFPIMPALPELPWSLALLEETPFPCAKFYVAPKSEERADLRGYRAQVAKIRSLFPECDFVDINEEAEARGTPLDPRLQPLDDPGYWKL
jgi:hypothetical protein